MTADESPCPRCGFGAPWMVEVRGQVDGWLFNECPACGHAWPRHPEGTRLHTVALEHIAGRVRP